MGMAFTDFKSLSEVGLAFQVHIQAGSFIQLMPRDVDEQLLQDLNIDLESFDVHASEASKCEALIFPILKHAWRPYADSLLLWSHVPLLAGEPLSGVPDYYFSRRSPLGLVREPPYVLVVQAKRDDFEEGWGQCLAAMLAAQRLNQTPARVIHGCVTNGDAWEFGKLDGAEFTREKGGFAVRHMSDLFAAWNYIFAQAKAQALASAA